MFYSYVELPEGNRIVVLRRSLTVCKNGHCHEMPQGSSFIMFTSFMRNSLPPKQSIKGRSPYASHTKLLWNVVKQKSVATWIKLSRIFQAQPTWLTAGLGTSWNITRNDERPQAAEQLRSESRSEESVSTALEADGLHPAANMDFIWFHVRCGSDDEFIPLTFMASQLWTSLEFILYLHVS